MGENPELNFKIKIWLSIWLNQKFKYMAKIIIEEYD